MATLLLIEDDRAARRTLTLAFEASGHKVEAAATGALGYQRWRELEPDLVLLDLMLPDSTGQQLLEQAREEGLSGEVIILTAHQDLERAILAMRAGAADYIHKPLNIDELELAVERALAERQQKRSLALVADLASERSGESLVGTSRAMIELHKQIGMAARGGATVLISGESGTGKELVARAIHRHWAPEQPFVPVNCSALVPSLLESELFGHVRGAFTGAESDRPGRAELAGEGSLFLDEIGDLEASLQVKLLRVLQERRFERVGSSEPQELRARVIAATHRDLTAAVQAGDFREDLFYRLNVVSIQLPPLRERIEDIEPLIEHLLARINRQLHRQVSRVPAETLEAMKAYGWPGNVRELENRLTAGVMTSPGDTLRVELPALSAPTASPQAGQGDWKRSLEEVEAEHIARVLEQVDHNYGRACEVLGISRPTLRRKMREAGLRDD